MMLTFKMRFYALVALQLLLLGGLIAGKQITLATGEPVLLKTDPVDPRDLFRGDYVALSYEISRLEPWKRSGGSFKKGDLVYVTLRRQGRFWVAETADKAPPEDGRLFIRGRAVQIASDGMRVEYGIESYFVPEGQGRELEREAGRGLTVEAAVDRHGRAVIRHVLREPRAAHR
jgi:uncharacterized membrane-anchored protein